MKLDQESVRMIVFVSIGVWFIMLFLWIIDISVTTMVNNPKGILVSLLNVRSSSNMYHLSLGGIALTYFITVFYFMHKFLKLNGRLGKNIR